MIWKHHYSLLTGGVVTAALLVTRPDFEWWFLLPPSGLLGSGHAIIIRLERRDVKMGDKTRSCYKCSGTFELIPPADSDYTVPTTKEQPSGKFITREYECNGKEKHVNKVYWQPSVLVGGPLYDPPHDDFGRRY